MYYEANTKDPEDYGKQVIFLWVTPTDRSFDYTGWIYKDTYDIFDYYETELWDNGQMTSDYLRSALLEYGVYVPEKATMTYDGDRGWKGWYDIEYAVWKDQLLGGFYIESPADGLGEIKSISTFDKNLNLLNTYYPEDLGFDACKGFVMERHHRGRYN